MYRFSESSGLVVLKLLFFKQWNHSSNGTENCLKSKRWSQSPATQLPQRCLCGIPVLQGTQMENHRSCSKKQFRSRGLAFIQTQGLGFKAPSSNETTGRGLSILVVFLDIPF